MKILDMSCSLNDRYIAETIDCLRNGGIIIYPTDSVYAIGCDINSNRAIEKVCKIKDLNTKRNNLSIICDSISQAAHYAKLDNSIFKIMKDNLPGPFTFILPALSTLPKAFKGRKTVGIRIPDNNIAVTIVKDLGHPIFTTTIEHKNDDSDYLIQPELIAELYANDVDIVIDGGIGKSTPTAIIDCTQGSFEIIREGELELK